MIRSSGTDGSIPIDRQQLVSVIIPTHQRPQAVRVAAESALQQTWTALEVIVVADGPDPATRAALEGLDPRLHFIELAVNSGPAAARNAGFLASRGDWLAFLDDDDIMLPTRIERQMSLADPSRPNQMISCRSVYRRGDRDDLWPDRPLAPGEDLSDYILHRPSILSRPGIISIQSLLLHRLLLTAVPFRPHRDHEDWAWLLEVWHQAHARVQFVWEPLVIYTIETEGASRSRRLNWSDSLDWAQEHRHWISDRAFCSFLATKVALKAKRAGDWKALGRIARLVLANGCSALDVAFLISAALLPTGALHTAWKRSLHSGREATQITGAREPIL